MNTLNPKTRITGTLAGEALPLLSTALDARLMAHGEAHPETTLARYSAGLCHLHLYQHAQAHATLVPLLASSSSSPTSHPSLPDKDPYMLSAVAAVAHCSDMLGRSAAALPQLRAAVEACGRVLGPEHATSVAACLWLASCLMHGLPEWAEPQGSGEGGGGAAEGEGGGRLGEGEDGAGWENGGDVNDGGVAEVGGSGSSSSSMTSSRACGTVRMGGGGGGGRGEVAGGGGARADDMSGGMGEALRLHQEVVSVCLRVHNIDVEGVTRMKGPSVLRQGMVLTVEALCGLADIHTCRGNTKVGGNAGRGT